MLCSRNTRKVFVEPVKVNIFLILDQIIPNACLAGVHPQNSAFMIDFFFFLRLCLAYSFTALFSLLLKALGKKKKTHFTYTVCAGHSCMFAALLEWKQIIARKSRHGWNLRFHISCTQKPWMWTSVLRWSPLWAPYRQLAGHISQPSSFSRSDRCRHLNSAHLKSPTARPPSSACHYYIGMPKGRRHRFSVTVAQQPSGILHLWSQRWVDAFSYRRQAMKTNGGAERTSITGVRFNYHPVWGKSPSSLCA